MLLGIQHGSWERGPFVDDSPMKKTMKKQNVIFDSFGKLPELELELIGVGIR